MDKNTICCTVVVAIIAIVTTTAFAEASTDNNLREHIIVQYHNGEYVLVQPGLESPFTSSFQQAYLVDSDMQLYSLVKGGELLLKVSENQFLEVEKASLNNPIDLNNAKSTYELHPALVENLRSMMKIGISNEYRQVELYTPSSINTYAKMGKTKYQIHIAVSEDHSLYRNVHTAKKVFVMAASIIVLLIYGYRKIKAASFKSVLAILFLLFCIPSFVYIPSPGDYHQVAKQEIKARKIISIQGIGRNDYTPRAVADQGTIYWKEHIKTRDGKGNYIYQDRISPKRFYTQPNYDSTKLLTKALEYKDKPEGSMYKEITYWIKYDGGVNYFGSI